MKEATLLSLPEGMEIDQILISAAGLEVSVSSTHPQSCCPLCSQPSSHIHSHYHRSLRIRSMCRTPASAFSHRAHILLPQPRL